MLRGLDGAVDQYERSSGESNMAPEMTGLGVFATGSGGPSCTCFEGIYVLECRLRVLV